MKAVWDPKENQYELIMDPNELGVITFALGIATTQVLSEKNKVEVDVMLYQFTNLHSTAEVKGEQ